MKKQVRLDLIRKLLSQQEIGRQQELQARLQELGVTVTQATLSRDLRELGVERHIGREGQSYYRLPSEESYPSLVQLVQYIRRLDRVEFNLVVHTGLGEADVLASSLDASEDTRILGTIAGADTLLIIARSSQDGAALEQEIRGYIEEEQ